MLLEQKPILEDHPILLREVLQNNYLELLVVNLEFFLKSLMVIHQNTHREQ